MIRTSTVLVAASTALVDLDDVKADLGLSGTADDAFLSRSIARASAAVVTYIGFHPLVETIEDRFDRESGACGASQLLQLSKFPVVAIAGVTDAEGTLTTDDVRLYARSGTLYRLADTGALSRWSALPVTVTYTAGHATIPGDLASAVVQMVRADYHARGRDPAIRTDTVEGIGSWTFFDRTGGAAIPADVAAALDSYREVGFA